MLLVSTGKQVADQIKSAFDAEHLRWRHGELLKLLAHRESTTQQQLLEALRVDPSVLVGLLNELERDGLIQRIRDPRDRRRHLVEISIPGRQALSNVLGGVEAVERAVFQDLSSEEQQTLQRLLIKVRDQLARPDSHADGCAQD